jgi:ADP-ribosylglycohydrolase
MQPRISGLATYPCGLIAAAMPAVGAYHFAHPDYAYLDGVELASVAQGQMGADWAGLCAAAIAAAFDATDGQALVNDVLKVAFRHSRELFYELDYVVRQSSWPRSEDDFKKYWLERGASPDRTKDNAWIAYNPIRFVLPVLRRFLREPEKLMALLVTAPDFMHVSTVSAAIGGAIAGAANGIDALPKPWRDWAEPIARPWFRLSGLVARRVRAEKQVIQVTERLAEPDAGGRSTLKEKVRGCILAGAIGNAMGSPVEGRMYWEVDKQHPGGIRTVLDPSRLEGEDDNQMAMLLVETYLAREGLPVMARNFGKMWKDRLNRDHFFAFCMGHSYDLIMKGWDPRTIGHWAVVTGSTVMCMEPVGTYHLADPAFAAIDGLAISYMYQRGLDAMAASMLAATVSEAFRPDATVDSVCQAALTAAPDEPFRTFDRRPFKSCRHYLDTCLKVAGKYDDVLAARKELYDKCLLYHQIDPLELWGFALAMFKIADGHVREAAIGGTNIGRDSDTISGRAAMLSGILRGAGDVPREWVDMFSKESLERIDRNADRLADLIVKGKLPLLRKRQELAAKGWKRRLA